VLFTIEASSGSFSRVFFSEFCRRTSSDFGLLRLGRLDTFGNRTIVGRGDNFVNFCGRLICFSVVAATAASFDRDEFALEESDMFGEGAVLAKGVV
jgi:hypothetical protein